jgi:RNA methyltransferase, TrmH family
MLNLHKIASLPSGQRLRKAEKLFAEADKMSAGVLPAPKNLTQNLELLTLLAKLLEQEERFNEAEQKIVYESRLILEHAWQSYSETIPRAAVNRIRHILATQVGKQTADWDLIESGGALSQTARDIQEGMWLYLEDVRSPFNIGSIFRSAESFCIEHIYISPLCASPEHTRAERSSMGCTTAIPWSASTLEKLEGPVFALETGGTPIEDFRFPAKGIMIIGSEELGVSAESLERADASLGRLSIPMYGAKGSLNVAVATGIALQAWTTALKKGKYN